MESFLRKNIHQIGKYPTYTRILSTIIRVKREIRDIEGIKCIVVFAVDCVDRHASHLDRLAEKYVQVVTSGAIYPRKISNPNWE